jgi:hypothetical protein
VEALQSFAPEYVKAGKTFAVSVVARAKRVRNVAVTMELRSGRSSTTPLVIDADGKGKVILTAPKHGRSFGFVFSWDQDAGKQAGCHGRDAFSMPLIHRGERIGDPYAYRLAGSYQARYTRGQGRARWKLRPRCDYFACDAKLRSSEGLKGRFRYRGRDGSYILKNAERRSHYGECPRALIRRTTIEFTRLSGPGPIAYRASGRVTDRYIAVGAARRAGCEGVTRHARLRITRR